MLVTQIGFMLQSPKETLLKHKQDTFLNKLNIHKQDRNKIFVNKSNLKLTKLGYKLAKISNVQFKKLEFEESLSVREIKEICILNEDIFYISPDFKKIFAVDLAFVSLHTIFNGNKKAMF